MTNKDNLYMKLQKSEAVIVQAAATIFAAYITAGKVNAGDEANWMKKAIKEAVQIAKATDEAIVADNEMD